MMIDITSIPGMHYAYVAQESANFISFRADAGKCYPLSFGALELLRDMKLRVVQMNFDYDRGLNLTCEKL